MHGSTAKAAVQHIFCCCLPWSGCDVHLGRSRLCSARCTFLLCTCSQSLNMPCYQLLLASWPGQTPACTAIDCAWQIFATLQHWPGMYVACQPALGASCDHLHSACEATLAALAMHLHDTVIRTLEQDVRERALGQLRAPTFFSPILILSRDTTHCSSLNVSSSTTSPPLLPARPHSLTTFKQVAFTQGCANIVQ